MNARTRKSKRVKNQRDLGPEAYGLNNIRLQAQALDFFTKKVIDFRKRGMVDRPNMRAFKPSPPKPKPQMKTVKRNIKKAYESKVALGEDILNEDLKKFIRLQKVHAKKKLKELEKEKEEMERMKIQKSVSDPEAKYSYHAFSKAKTISNDQHDGGEEDEVSELDLNIRKRK